MKTLSLISLLIMIGFSAVAQQTTFRKQMALRSAKLGPQCAFENLQQAKAATALELSDDQFNQNIAFLGFQISHLETMYHMEQLETKDLCFMNKQEVTALMMYSMDVYRKLNTALREQDQAKLTQFNIYIQVLNSALDKIKNFEGYIKRGVKTSRARYDDHIVGQSVIYSAYTSASIGKGFAGNIRTLIASKNCKYIAPFSIVPIEEEVLCKAGTEFKVIYRKDNKRVLHLILEEVSQP